MSEIGELAPAQARGTPRRSRAGGSRDGEEPPRFARRRARADRRAARAPPRPRRRGCRRAASAGASSSPPLCAEEALAARADQERPAERGERVEAAEELRGSAGGLAEAEAGVEHDLRRRRCRAPRRAAARAASSSRTSATTSREARSRAASSRARRGCASGPPGSRRAATAARHRRVGERGDVVDQVGAGGERGARRPRPCGCRPRAARR